MYFLLIKEDHFTWWIEKALLPYLAHGRTIGGRNQHWKRRIENMNWHQNSLDGTIYPDYEHKTFTRPRLDPYQKLCFSILVDIAPNTQALKIENFQL
jgi:hypothetical protein